MQLSVAKDSVEPRRISGEHTNSPEESVSFQSTNDTCMAIWNTYAVGKCQDEEKCVRSKDECSTVRREFSSPGPGHLVFGPSPSSSCQLSLRRVEAREGKAGERNENMRYQIYFVYTLLRLKRTA